MEPNHAIISILLVEDNPGDARLIREMLSDSDRDAFTIAHVGTLQEAVGAMTPPVADVVLLDLSLPDASGLEAFREIMEHAPDCPIVVLTGLHDERVALRAVREGAQDYLIKGEVTGPLLSRAIRYGLERKRTETNLRVMAEANEMLTSTLDYAGTLHNVANLLVPRFADQCAVDMVDPTGAVRRLMVVSRDGVEGTFAETPSPRPPHRTGPGDPSGKLAGGGPDLLSDLALEAIEAAAGDESHLEGVEALCEGSSVALPLMARGRFLGALTLFLAKEGRRSYGQKDVSLLRDLAGRAALALDNARLYREAREAINARDEMLAIVSHDLRNPLHAITLGASLARRRAAGRDSEMCEDLEEIEEIAGQMDRFIQDLLDVTRLEAGRFPLRLASHEIGEIIREACAQIQVLAGHKGIAIRHDTASVPAKVVVDRARILQVLMNLLGNAIKFSGAEGSVVVGSALLEDRARISVADSGPGISGEDLPHLFQRYWQGRQEGGGVGLGLAIAKGIVELHRGEMEVESEVGRGTTFSFTIPLAAGPPDGDVAPRGQRTADRQGAVGGRSDRDSK